MWDFFSKFARVKIQCTVSFIDIIILIVFAGAVFVGIRKGIIAQIGSVAAIVLGILACRLFGDKATEITCALIPELTSDSATSHYAASVLGNVLLFVLVYLSAKLLASLVKTAAHALMLGILDRVLGVVFCMFKWFLVMSIVLNLWLALFPSSGLVSSSKIGNGLAVRTVLDIAPRVFGFITAPATEADKGTK